MSREPTGSAGTRRLDLCDVVENVVGRDASTHCYLRGATFMTTSREAMAASRAHRRWARSGREPAMTDNQKRGTPSSSACGPFSTPSERRDDMAQHIRIKVNGLVHSVTASLDTPLLYVLRNELPSEDQIRTAMNGHLCRCGTYPRILTAIKPAAAVTAKAGA